MSRPASPRRPLVHWGAVAAVVVAIAGPAFATDSTSGGGDADRGEELFQANCAMCHGGDATGMGGMHPALTGVIDRLGVDGVEVTIRNGRDTTPPMPAFGDDLSAAEIADVVAYLDTLPPGPRNFGPMHDPDTGMMGDNGMMGDDGMMGEGMMGGATWLWMLLGVLLVAAVIVGIVVIAVVVIRKTSGSPAPPGTDETPRQILDARYARGELTREDYLQARRDLGD